MMAAAQAESPAVTRAVCFDVDFTLIYPGPMFQGAGYVQFCTRHGLTVDAALFRGAVTAASAVLDEVQDHVYDPRLFIRYIRRIIEHMGGQGAGIETCAREIYDEWAKSEHFELYDDVVPTLRMLASQGRKLALISNTHRCLASLRSHFELDSLISVAISSSEHGFNKPHPSIFRTALQKLHVEPREAVMVGDNVKEDIEGALAVGMRAVLLCRSGQPRRPLPACDGQAPVPVIHRLDELPALL